MRHQPVRKLASLLLAALMTFYLPGFCAVTALAAGRTIPVSTEDELIAAIADASAGDIIGLAQDITLSADLTVDNNVTIVSAGAKIIAGSRKIIIPAGSSVSFGAALGVTGSAATGYRDGLVVVQGGLTIQPGSVSITNSYTGGGNSSTVYVDGGWLEVQGGAITDDPDELNITGNAVLLNGGYLDTTSGGSAIAITGSGCGISSGGGADVSLYTGTVSGNCGVLFSGTNGGGFYMNDGTVFGNYAGIRIVGSAPEWVSGIIGGAVTANNGYGVELEDFSSFLITGCDIAGTEGEGGVFVESGSTAKIYLDDLSIAGGIRVFDETMDGAAFLTALPAVASVTKDGSLDIALIGSQTTFALDGETSADLNASLSPDTHTVTLHPTLASSQTLVLTSSVDLYDEDYGGDYSNTLRLTIPVEVTDVTAPTVTTGAISGLTATGATIAGGVTSNGGEAPAAYGVVYGTGENPTTANGVVAGIGTAGSFTAALTGLSPDTIYHARAYASNSAGASYGSDVSFMTLSSTGAMIPTVLTGNRVVGTDAGLPVNQLYAYGNVTKQGFSDVTERGILYYTGSASPDALNFVVNENPYHDPAVIQVPDSMGGGGEYRVLITNSSATANYWFRAYAVNGNGTNYGTIEYTSLHGTTIHVDTEDGGEVVIGPESAWTGTPDNTKGALFWNGSAWASNDTAAHMYYTDLLTGERLKNYTDIVIPAETGTQTQNAIGFAAEEYSYQTVAANGGGTYQYTGIKYTLTQADGKKIILLSRGMGRGTDVSCFDVFIENATEGTLAVRKGGVLYSYAVTAAEALSADDLSSNVMGLLRTEDVYWFDQEGGSDMGGVTYSVHTGEMPSALVTAPYLSRTIQVKRFDLMLMSADYALYRYILSPSLTSETFIPATGPTVASLSPASGPEAGGTSVTITGTNFIGVTAVKFGVSNAVYNVNSDTQIIAVSPAGTGTVHVTVTTADGTSAATSADRFTYTSPGGGGGGSVGSTYHADVKEGGVRTDTLPVTVGGSTGTANLGAAKAPALFDTGNASVVMPSIPVVSAYTLKLPAFVLDAGQKGGALTLSTGFGSVTFPDNMLGSLTGMGGKTAGITVARGDTSGLTDAEKAAVGDRPLIELTLTLDGVQTSWNSSAAPVTVAIPYTPTAEELQTPESILIWYLDGSDRPVCIPSGHYDAATGTVTFTATHFSPYAVGYNPVSFQDVAPGAWHYGAVTFIAARGITIGTGGGNYSPDASLTRGQFIVMLMRAYGIEPDENPNDNFSDAGNTWYTNYLAAAMRLGIADGIGDNRFAPEQAITRQEMFTLLYRVLGILGELPVGASGKTLPDFSDAASVASWARDAISRLVQTGIVSGSGGRLSPEDTATRAEMAQMLYNLLMR